MNIVRIFNILAGTTSFVIGSVVIYYAVVFEGPLPDHPFLRGKNDLALHFAAFFALSTPLLLILRRDITVVGLVLFAGLIEIVQAFQVRRNADLADFALGIAGIALGVIIVAALRAITSPTASNKE